MTVVLPLAPSRDGDRRDCGFRSLITAIAIELTNPVRWLASEKVTDEISVVVPLVLRHIGAAGGMGLVPDRSAETSNHSFPIS
jgi:hypothetical protein